MSDTVITAAAPLPQVSRSRGAVAASYAAQGLGYAVVVTALPALKGRQQIDDTVVSLIILLVCIAAAGGSIVADRIAGRRGSRTALITGLVLECIALLTIAAPVGFGVFVAAFAVYGLGLGMVDASGAMQGVLVQQRVGVSVMAGFFAFYTGAAIVGALMMSALATSASSASVALIIAAVVAAGIALGARLHLDPRLTGIGSDAAIPGGTPVADAAADTGPTPTRAPLPRRGIWIFGLVVLAAFVVDSAVSTWSTVYLHDVLLTSAGIAPLGYAAYQGAILLTRLGTDRLVRRYGRSVLAATTATIAVGGLVLVATVPSVGAAVLGFALAGFAVGALVPLAFSAAGELDVARSDEVISRVNLFNYAGAVLGAVLVGLLADGPGLGAGFLLPMALLIPVLFLVRRFGGRPVA